MRVDRGNTTMRERMSRVEFVVNSAKRTVVALVFGSESPDYYELREKGITKCAPDDCFNAHIGKAIALRRALGLEVPTEYLNVPQPTEVRVGDVVEHYKVSGKFFVCDDAKFPPIGKPFVSLNTLRALGDVYKIVDDSRTEGGA